MRAAWWERVNISCTQSYKDPVDLNYKEIRLKSVSFAPRVAIAPAHPRRNLKLKFILLTIYLVAAVAPMGTPEMALGLGPTMAIDSKEDEAPKGPTWLS